MTPKYGNCRDCAAWMNQRNGGGFCCRHPPVQTEPNLDWLHPWTNAMEGCFDHISKEESK
jgi:hypothetical protein